MFKTRMMMSTFSRGINFVNVSPRFGATQSKRAASSIAHHPVVSRLTTASYLLVTATTGVALLYYLSDSRAFVYEYIGMPLMHAFFDPEEAHTLSIAMLKYGCVPKDKTTDPSILSVNIWGKTISNPIGLAAGYDKHGEGIDSLLGFGFGMVEVGSVTPRPQEGNQKPRFFRLPEDNAVINRYGFNSHGHDAVYSRLMTRIRDYAYRHSSQTVSVTENEKDHPDQHVNSYVLPPTVNRSLKAHRLLGLNLGKNKTSPMESNQDYVDGIIKLGPLADYLVINVSSPNTKGLRSLQARDSIRSLLSVCKKTRDTDLKHRPPLLVKIAPDLTDEQILDIAQVVQEVGIDGVIISNTTISRPEILEGDSKTISQFGGLSGKPLKPLSLSVVSKFYKATNGSIPIIGCGGISSAQDAIEFAKAGASLVQLYTSLGYKGPGLIPKIKTDLSDLLAQEGVSSWSELVGKKHKLSICSK